MKALIRVVLMAALTTAVLPHTARAQETPAGDAVSPALKAQVTERYRVLAIRDGILLTPRRGPQHSIEITGDGIAVDGQPVSGRELRDRVGGDASMILQLSYVNDPQALRHAFGEGAAAAVQTPPVAPPAPEPPPAPPPEDEMRPERPRHRSGGSRVRFGGHVRVGEDEHLRSEVVAILGSVDVDGRVDGEVVSVLGGVRLGPHADVRGEVVSIGGPILREPGAQVRGDVVEIAFAPHVFAPVFGGGMFGADLFSGWYRLMGTGLRVALLMLVTLAIVAIASGPVSRISARAGEDPWVCGFVGLAAEILFVPVLVVTIVFLAISIIGIPLLLLVPFAIVALFLGVLMGFAGVARRLGLWVVGRDRSSLVAAAVGVVLIVAGAIMARLLWLIPGPIGPIAFTVGAIGLFLEYVAWTVGLGALLLTRFGTLPRATYPPQTWEAPPAAPPLASEAP